MRIKLTEKVVNRLRSGEQASDSTVVGFSARRQTSGAVSFCLRYRIKGNPKPRVTVIGRFLSPWSVEDARQEATRLLLEAAQGRDPVATAAAAATAALTVADLVAEYTEAMTSGKLLLRSGKPKKQSTQVSDKGRLALHVLPVLGKVILSDLTKHHCEKLLHAIADGITTKRQPGKRQANSARGGKGAATRTLTLLGAVLNFAVDRGYIATNPCRALRTFAVVKRDRHLDDGEYAALGQAMRNPPPATSPAMLAAVRFATLSGWRMGEVTGLRWDAIDFQRRMVVLADTKTGSSTRPLNQACIAILDAQERVPGQVLVFNPSRRQPAVYAFRATFNKLLRAAGLSGSGITPHVLRHSFVSTAGDLEQTESSIAACVGHATRSMTGRYMHRSDASLLAAADTIGRRLLVLLGDDTSEPVTVSPLPRPSAARPRLAVPEAASEAA